MDILCIIPRVSGYLQVPSHGGARPLQGAIIYDEAVGNLTLEALAI